MSKWNAQCSHTHTHTKFVYTSRITTTPKTKTERKKEEKKEGEILFMYYISFQYFMQIRKYTFECILNPFNY